MTIFHRALGVAAGGAALLMTVIAAPSQAQEGGCRAALPGTYLAEIRTEQGAFASRALITLHGDGTLVVVDSRQHAGVDGASFSSQRGNWRCAGHRVARGVSLNFGFPPHATLARSDWSIERGDRGRLPGTIVGTIALTIFNGVEGVDPFGQGGRNFGPFRFTGQRVMPGR